MTYSLSTTNLTLPPDAPIDLQLHTTYSDGKWTPEALIDHLVSEGFGLAAITDHDRADTAVALQQLAAEKHFPLLVAAEISASWHGEPTDLLCFGFDPDKPALSDLTRDIIRRQRENTREIWQKMRQQGHTMPDDNALDQLLQVPSAQQPHSMVALLKQHGFETPGKLMMEAGFAFATVEAAAAVEAVHQSGGVCLIAHPGRGDGYVKFDDDLLDQLRSETPIDGFEVYYPDHSPEQTAMYLDYAQKHNLLTSSGSDSHAPDNPPIKYRAELSRKLLERLGVVV